MEYHGSSDATKAAAALTLMPNTPTNSVQLVRELLDSLRQAEENRRNRPLLKAWSLKIPLGLHRKLKALSKASGHSMTLILVATAELALPTLQAAFERQQALQEAPALPESRWPVAASQQPITPPVPTPLGSGRFFSSTSSTW